MGEIIDNLRANEPRYRSLEIVLRRTYRLVEPKYRSTHLTAIEEGTDRYVYQDALFYFHSTKLIKRLSGSSHRIETLQVYDGRRTIAIEQGSFAILRDYRWEDPRLLRPQTMILRSLSIAVPLSEYLEGRIPASRSASDPPQVGLDSQQILDGLPCVKIRLEPSAKPRPRADPSITFLYLSPHHNYLPVRLERYNPNVNPALPFEVARADQFSEIATGVWFPFHASISQHDEDWLREGKIVVANLEEYTVQKALLGAQYDTSHFRNVLPSGIRVYVIQNGIVAKTYFHTGELWTSPKPGVSRWVVASAVLLLMFAAVCAFVYFRTGQLPWLPFRWPSRTARRLFPHP